MPKKKSLLEKTQEELTDAIAQRDEATRQFEYWSIRRTDSMQRVERLQAALDALEGRITMNLDVPKKSLPFLSGMNPVDAVSNKSIPPTTWTPQTTLTGKTVQIDEQEFVLEPGFKLGKNSFGEDAIVPDDMPIQPMAEPSIPSNKIDFNFPSVEGEEFIDPEKLF